MGRPHKVFIHHTVISIVCRVQEGLPFVATLYMKLIIQNALAGAQELYPVKIVGFLLMGNHLHLILVVENPADVSSFMRYFKTETSIAINRLLGRRQRSVWTPRYSSPVILDAEKVLHELAYLYTNPQRARLVNTIEEYPQLSTWKELLSGNSSTSLIPSFSRDAIPTLSGPHTQQQSVKVYEELLRKSKHQKKLKIEPFAWLDCFAETKGMSHQTAVELVVKRVRAREWLLRQSNGPEVLGREALLRQDIRTPHTPKKFGKAMTCLSFERLKRIQFLDWFKTQTNFIREGFQNWKNNLIPFQRPPGFFEPGGRMAACLLPFIFQL